MIARPAAVEFTNISAGYRGSLTLKSITLCIETGRITGIYGPNGCGKTTLLRVVQGLLPISAGNASVLGLELITSNYKQVRRRTACVFQTLNIDPRMPVTAGEVVMMGRYGRMGLLERPGQSDKDAVRRALKLVDAKHLANRPFGQLSGGEQQRINLARALAQEPELLLLDEPTTFLDSQSQKRIRDVMRNVHREIGLTTIVVSHDAGIFSELCEQIVVMKHGSVIQVASSKEFADA